ncbi:MAG TPA: glycosyltransferase family 2 protein [Candidatus Microsaccharimonas sp.]|jgi:dolichol-phosphate mannosyltransferase
MTNSHATLLSVIVPVFNEEGGIVHFHESLVSALEKIDAIRYEIIYSDDGSTDQTASILHQIAKNDHSVRIISLSRNFGKEYALTAGISQARGDALITIDGDGQHPVSTITDFVQKWRDGAQVVVGVRKNTTHRFGFKTLRSKVFYKLFNSITGEQLLSGATDFRLIDREVQQAFLQLGESDRITRGLIDWLGFDRTFIYFDVLSRDHGSASYNTRQLTRLAVNSFVSLSPVPLYIFGYTGVIITALSGILGIAVFIEQVVLRDPMSWKFTGTAMLGILILFLVGILLTSQGIVSLYISHIHNQSKRRPLFVINHKKSLDVDKK